MHAQGKKTLSISLCGIAVSAVAALGFGSAVSATSNYSISNTGPGSKNVISAGSHGYGGYSSDWNKWMEHCGYGKKVDHDKHHSHKDDKDDKKYGWKWTYEPASYPKHDKKDDDKKHYGHKDKKDDHKDYGHDKKEKKHGSHDVKPVAHYDKKDDHKDYDKDKKYSYDKKDRDHRDDDKHYGYKKPQRSYEQRSETSYRVENNNNVNVDNDVRQEAKSGDATVYKNTRGGNATSGNVRNESVVATNVSLDNRSSQPSSGQRHSQPAHQGYGDYRSTSRTDYRVENNNDVNISNDVEQEARSGNATVSRNTWGGNATTGSAVNYSSITSTVSIRN